MTRTTHRDFDSLRIEGGIFPGEFLNAVRELKLKGQGSTDYGLHRTLKLRDEIGRYWRIAKSEWEAFNEARQRQDIDRSALAVERFLLPLLQQVFGFSDLQACRQPRHLGERRFPLSHEAGFAEQAPASSGLTLVGEADDAPRRIAHIPLVLTGPDFDMDKSHPAFGDEGRRRSPQGLLQEYLNASGEVLWGIVSNGLVLRILRDNPSMTRPAFVEVDLARLFEDDLYPDFVALWLTLHASRFLAQNGKIAQCWLEQWREQAVEEGERARSDLRAGVEQALRALGGGFVAHPANQALREALSSGQLSPNAYFQQLLRLVYRLLFLLTAEDRNILHDPATATPDARRLYVQGYSLTLLRERARKRRFYDDYADLWQALTTTFAALRSGQPLLGLPALGGLFAGEQCADLDAAQLGNKALLSAIRAVCWVQRKNGATRINYRDMDTEELGSVYESLLELIPRINPAASPWQFGFIGDAEGESDQGNARKTSGSYYTPDSLVQELIQSALLPVIDQRLKANPEQPRAALLSIKVCDPACGSGHFLLAAARRLAARLAELDAQGDQYTEKQYRHALREVVLHCIHGVDLNPMAIELCKTALWLEALEPGKPLGFLDAHIQCGNALIGVSDPAVLEAGIPDDAYKALTGDSKAIASEAKKRNKQAAKKLAVSLRISGSLASSWEALPEDTVEQVAAKQTAWQAAQQGDEARQARLLEDLYTAAFFVPKDAEHERLIPTNQELIAAHQGQLSPDGAELAQGIARRQRFFHWRLAFPQVFEREQGGFDVVLGNPPWERIKLQEKEFFAARLPAVANARNAAERQQMIEALAKGLPWERELQEEFYSERRGAEASSLFARSGRYPLTGVGDVNLYALFAEHMLHMIGQGGRAGVIVPTGIATDDGTKAYFAHIAGEQKLASLYDFENREGLFPGVHRSYKFSLLTLADAVPQAELVFFATQVEQLQESQRRFSLTAGEFALLNPNTRTCAVFRSQADAEITKKIYSRVPVLVRDEPPANPWGITIKTRLFHMAEDSHLFLPKGDHSGLPVYEAKMVHHYDHRWATYERDGETSRDMTDAEKQQPDCLPLPRYWVDEWEVVLRTSDAPKILLDAWKLGRPDALILCFQYWLAGEAKRRGEEKLQDLLLKKLYVHHGDTVLKGAMDMFAAEHISEKLAENYPLTEIEYQQLLSLGSESFKKDFDPFDWAGAIEQQARAMLRERCPKYLLGWRDICRSTDERTVIASVLPWVAVGHTMPLMFPKTGTPAQKAALLANLDSLVYDFVARQKIGGTHLTYTYLKQFPTLPPDAYSEADLAYIVPRVLELAYTAHDLKPFAEDLGYDGEPFPWNPDRRHQLKCELDAYYAHLYGLTRDELLYILDPQNVMPEDYPSVTFPTLKRKELAEFGEYRTQVRVMAAYEQLKGNGRQQSC
ncbi:Methyltransferase domain-containing protein [Azotobacter beijerinckii]|uniref:site-specific DNA-methyltransferase (adenine-specific) n=1 Tax=Azotobacter beijerinckii TaxID=170623 RepID=A0A1H6W1V9_9GAMM|nr:N-6 DNA methylase [Azotobacter beijerinckii]SEJ06512.1 Methyltransferase domain-containing protein [Azotobacter beijerinckii]